MDKKKLGYPKLPSLSEISEITLFYGTLPTEGFHKSAIKVDNKNLLTLIQMLPRQRKILHTNEQLNFFLSKMLNLTVTLNETYYCSI